MKQYEPPIVTIVVVSKVVVRTSGWADDETKDFGEDWKW